MNSSLFLFLLHAVAGVVLGWIVTSAHSFILQRLSLQCSRSLFFFLLAPIFIFLLHFFSLIAITSSSSYCLLSISLVKTCRGVYQASYAPSTPPPRTHSQQLVLGMSWAWVLGCGLYRLPPTMLWAEKVLGTRSGLSQRRSYTKG